MSSRSLAIVSFLLFEILITQASCSASTYQLQDEINAYNQNDFSNVISIGRLLENEATDTICARYYLANAYTRMNRIPEAIQEYTVCWREGRDPKIIAFAQQALQALKNLPNTGALRQSDYQTNNSPDNTQNASSLLAVRRRIMQEEDQSVARVREMNEKQIRDISLTRDQDIAAVPRYFPVSFPNQIPQLNPDYNSTVSSINNNAQLKIDSINDTLNKNINLIRSGYEAKISALDSSADSLPSQVQPGNSDIQLTETGSNVYVKNYINYGADTPAPLPVVGLKAVEKMLVIKTPQTIKQKKPSI